MNDRNSTAAGAALGAILAAALLAPVSAGAAALAPGSYEVDGVHAICLKSDGTWYGEDFHGWGGDWMLGLNGQTAIFGNYSSGAGNDSMVVKKGVVQWSEWSDSLNTQSFLRGAFTFLKTACGPPARSSPPGHQNPTD